MKKYFLHDGTTQHGPFDLAELETKIITAQTLVWFESLPDWKPAGEIEELKNLVNNKVPASQIITPPLVMQKEEDWSRKSYYYTDNHGQQGPFTLEQLKNRPITASTPVWYDPLPEWTTADKVEGLKNIINSPRVTGSGDEDWSKKQFYYTDSTGQKGPFTLEQLKSKAITGSTPVWYDPLPEWTTAGKVEGLKNIIDRVTTASQVTSSQEADLSKKQFYYTDSSGQKGPFTLEQLKTKAIAGSTPVWYDPLPEWTTAGKVEGLKNIIDSVATAPQVMGSQEADLSKKRFYYTDSSGQKGPFTLEQLQTKPITGSTPVWYDPLPEWTTAGKVEGLKNIIDRVTTVPQVTGSQEADLSKKQFYYTDSSGQKGPFTLEQLQTKPITGSTPVWFDPLPEWTTAGKVEGLKNIIDRATAVPLMPGSLVEDLSKKQFYYTDSSGQKGPFSLEELKSKSITAATPVWYDPLPEWTTAGKVEGLKHILS